MTKQAIWILALQSFLTFAQVVNAGIASVTHDLLVTLLVGAFVAGLQVFVQHIGNQSVPIPIPAQDPPKA